MGKFILPRTAVLAQTPETPEIGGREDCADYIVLLDPDGNPFCVCS